MNKPFPPGYPYGPHYWPDPQPMPGTPSDLRRREGTMPLPLAVPMEAGAMGPAGYYQPQPNLGHDMSNYGYPPNPPQPMGQQPPQPQRFYPMDPNYIGTLSERDFLDQYTRVPAWYIITIEIAEALGNVASGSQQIRPEPFWLKRITWASTGGFANQDVNPVVEGRAVEVEWADEFVKFFGSGKAALLSAIFGDSQGFLDIPGRVLFQGKQTLVVNLNRVVVADQVDRYDIVFHGLGLLPRGMNQSGSAT